MYKTNTQIRVDKKTKHRQTKLRMAVLQGKTSVPYGVFRSNSTSG